jgi:hypothetical protein
MTAPAVAPTRARLRRVLLPSLAIAAALGLAASGAHASATTTTYYASPTATASSPCTLASPCRLDYAVASAGDGATVIVLPGSYSVSYPVRSDKAITVQGEPGAPRPVLNGAANLGGATLSFTNGATVEHLDIVADSSASGHPAALSLTDGVVQDVIAEATANESHSYALDLTANASGVSVRTVLAVSDAAGGAAIRVVGQHDSKTLTLVNVTAVGRATGAEGLVVDLPKGAATITDSVVRGGAGDIVAGGGGAIAASYTDFRPARSSGYTSQAGDISAAPVFTDSANSDFSEDATSPTIAVGIAAQGRTPGDLNGDSWGAGLGPDLGAYEYVPTGPTGSTGTGTTGTSTTGTGTTGTSTTGTGTTPTGTTGTGQGTSGPALPPPSDPVAGVSVTLRPAGLVSIRLPGHRLFVALTRAAQLPVGTTVNATRGTVKLTSAIDLKGRTKTGRFTGGSFVVRQSRGAHPLTRLALAGGSFAACTRIAAVTHTMKVTARMARPLPGNPRRVVRQLWGSDRGGRFTTIGRSASAAVRGTVWLTQDRCDGTMIRVLRGHVVVFDRKHHRHVVVGPGHAYLARS